MTEALQRGSVVLRGGRYAVVWDVRGRGGEYGLVLLPIVRAGDEARAGDVELGFADLLGGGIAVPDGVVRASSPIEASVLGQICTGAIRGGVLCRVVLAVARAYATAVGEEVWTLERRHRREAASNRAVRP